MAKKDLRFTGYFMTVNQNALKIEMFKENIQDKEYPFIHEGTYYRLYPEFTDSFLYIPMTHGSPYPHPEKVINTETGEQEDNPRAPNQYEPNEDFAIVDFKTGYLWISNVHKKIVLWTFFTAKLKTPYVLLKEVFDQDEFIAAIKSVDEVRFSGVPNLFSTTNTLSEELSQEINGYGAATAVIEFKYHKKLVGDSLREKLKNLIHNRNSFKNVMIAGKDANNTVMRFISDQVQKKLVIRTELNENHTFDSEDVLTRLKKELS